MSDMSDYFTAQSLADAAGVSLRTFFGHLQNDVGQVSKAREKVPGLGIRYNAKACRKYIALVTAGRNEGRVAV